MAWRRRRARADELRALELELATLQLETVRAELATSHAETEDTRAALARRDGELTVLVERIAATCARLEARLEADRAERRALAEALARIAETLAAGQAAPLGHAPSPGSDLEHGGATVIGGSVRPGEATALRDPTETVDEVIVIPEEAHERGRPGDDHGRNRSVSGAAPLGAGDECAVRFRFDNRWIDGFEICETVRDNGCVRYRLRRRLDGWVLPEMFEAADVRRFDRTGADVLDLTD